ncbi:MAG: rhodanese-like domain-containing protein [Turicibacter sp.]
MKHINMVELQKKIGNINLIDVREVSEYKTGYIPTAKNIPMNQLIQNPAQNLNQNEDYYIVCQSGGRSQMVCMMLEVQGYTVHNVVGGTGAFPGQLA